jgi:tRNA-dihydrouridine synthase
MGFDGIDINMGCPVREVIKKKAGAGMIGEYELAKKAIESVKKGVKNKIPVSVKTRLGLNTNINEEWSEFLLKQDIAVLTMHGRTAKQMSKVPADWNEIAKVVEIRNRVAPETLIVGNGDVKSFDEIRQKNKFYGVDGVMIGRGIFQNPWIFSPDKTVHTKEDYINLLLKHLELFDKTWGKEKNFAIVKKFFKMYVNNFPGASKLRIKLMECNSYEEVLEEVKCYNQHNG